MKTGDILRGALVSSPAWAAQMKGLPLMVVAAAPPVVLDDVRDAEFADIMEWASGARSDVPERLQRYLEALRQAAEERSRG